MQCVFARKKKMVNCTDFEFRRPIFEHWPHCLPLSLAPVFKNLSEAYFIFTTTPWGWY